MKHYTPCFCIPVSGHINIIHKFKNTKCPIRMLGIHTQFSYSVSFIRLCLYVCFDLHRYNNWYEVYNFFFCILC